MKAPAKVNIADVIDNIGIGSFQVRLFVLCAMSLIMAGFCVQCIGFVIPAISDDWAVPRPEFGRVIAAGNFGVLLGALVFTMVADKIGRRPVLVGATVFFGLTMVIAAFSSTLDNLLLIRFIGGLGMGCIIPNATALIGEYSPRQRRVTFMMNISVAFTAGAALVGLASTWLIPNFGWRSVFLLGGSIPVVIGVLMFFWLPESLQFLVVRGKDQAKVVQWLGQIDPTVSARGSTQYVVMEENKGGVPVQHVFREGRAAGTILLWLVNFTNISNLYFLSAWLPTVITGAGYSQFTALLAGTTLQVGGTIGTFALASVIARKGFISVLTACFALACICVALIGQPGMSIALIFLTVFVAGWCIVGGQPALNALAGTFYPTYLRSTGIGWCLGIGRMGAILGPYIGGELIRRQWTNSELFMTAAVPALISTLVIFSLRWATMKDGSAAPAKTVPVAR
jgi:AAHS family 4-hydroxybenzoate transporter-like MFS transporter